MDELERTPTRSPDAAGPARRESRRRETVSVADVLEVLADFEPFGGASPELVAWELDVDQTSVATAWSQAVDDRLLTRSGIDRTHGHEEIWRLTERGHHARERSKQETA